MITQKELKEDLSYNHETGIFINLKTRNSGAIKGREAGVILSNGYMQITVRKQRFALHRLAWFYVHGRWPKNEIDHINHVPSDNRIENLREATRTENSRNRSLQAKNRAGINGVNWYPRHNKWRATIGSNGYNLHLGYFASKAKAVARRETADILLGYHKNHGGS